MEGLFHLIQMLIIPAFILGTILLILGSPVAGRIIFLVVFFALLFPILWELLPLWVILTFIILISSAFLQALLTFILGRRVAELVIGGLVTDLFRVIIRVIILPFHFVRRLINLVANR